MAAQLMLFEETREEKLFKKVQELEEKLDRQRKGQFAKIGALAKMFEETKNDLEILKAAICRGEYSKAS